VDFSHYSSEPVELAAELVNTLTAGKHDTIAELSGLRGFLDRHHHLWMEDSLPPAEGDVGKVRDLRRRLRAVFEAGDADTASDLLNKVLADNGAVPRISTHGGSPHLHFETSGTSFSRWLAVVTAMGLATVVVDQGVERFGVCAAEDCAHVFIDTSRNRSRRHCSTKCASRENVAAFRKRRRAQVRS
jgi:predicted RNA-binding Zn ribbon-like protein